MQVNAYIHAEIFLYVYTCMCHLSITGLGSVAYFSEEEEESGESSNQEEDSEAEQSDEQDGEEVLLDEQLERRNNLGR